ncbi:MAG: glutaminyl-peptide cyclotransferase [Chitinophagaceae bacterium]
MKLLFYLVVFIYCFSACNNPEIQNNGDNNDPNSKKAIPPIIGYSIVKIHPHDSSYFTEGLEFYNGELLESSGGNNDDSPYPSEMGIVNNQTGKVTTKIPLDRAKYFGEGITVFNNKLYMLTYISKVGFVFDIKTFKKIQEFNLPTQQGWGLTHDSSSIIMSDGSNSLHYLDPTTLQVKNILGVLDNNGPVSNINELEYVNGFIYANQWQTSYILKIDASSGKVVGRIDLSSIENEITSNYSDTNGLNGIAYNTTTGNFLITGKRWPFSYEIKLQ